MNATRPLHVVAMGVSGTGKSTVSARVAQELDLDFIEGDDHHCAVNRKKMVEGIPLTDEDRMPWLHELAGLVAEREQRSASTILTCSALRRAYRDVLREPLPRHEMFFVHLHAGFDVLLPRMGRRAGHFMPSSLLQSQFDTLEPLEADESGSLVDVAPPLAEVVRAAVAAIRDFRSTR